MLFQLANLRLDFDLIFGQLLARSCKLRFGLFKTLMQLLDFVLVPGLVLYNAVTQLLDFVFVPGLVLYDAVTQLLDLDLVPSGSLRNVSTEFLDFGFVPSFRLDKALTQLLDFGIILRNEGMQPADRSGKQIGLGRFRSLRSLCYLFFVPFSC